MTWTAPFQHEFMLTAFGVGALVGTVCAATGVDYLSVGALTHSSPILDIALDLDPDPS